MNDDTSQTAVAEGNKTLETRPLRRHFLWRLDAEERMDFGEHYVTPGGAMYHRLFTADMSYSDALYCLEQRGFCHLTFDVKNFDQGRAVAVDALSAPIPIGISDKWTTFITYTRSDVGEDAVSRLVFACKNPADLLLFKMKLHHDD